MSQITVRTMRQRCTIGNAMYVMPMRPEEAEALAFLEPLSGDYPNITQWYRRKVVPGLRAGSRTLIRVARDGQLVGLGIGKSEPDERKICTVRVASSHMGRGIGVRIFDSLLRWLDVDRPHLTISEAKRSAFERIFDYYGFEMTSIRVGLYVPTACELGYNESCAVSSVGMCSDMGVLAAGEAGPVNPARSRSMLIHL